MDTGECLHILIGHSEKVFMLFTRPKGIKLSRSEMTNLNACGTVNVEPWFKPLTTISQTLHRARYLMPTVSSLDVGMGRCAVKFAGAGGSQVVSSM